MTVPNLSDGSSTVTMNINEDIDEQENPYIVVHQLPNRDGEITQDIGRGSKRINLAGFTVLQSEKNSLQTWAKNRTQLTYNDDENTNIKVRILNPVFTRVKGVPNYYKFSFTLVEDE